MKCSGENLILRGIFHVVSRFPLLFMLYRGNLDCFSNRVSKIFVIYSNPKIELADPAGECMAAVLVCLLVGDSQPLECVNKPAA